MIYCDRSLYEDEDPPRPWPGPPPRANHLGPGLFWARLFGPPSPGRAWAPSPGQCLGPGLIWAHLFGALSLSGQLSTQNRPQIGPKSTSSQGRRKVVTTSSQLRRRCVDRLSRQALACLAYLASDRPRSPCLHQQQQQRRSAPPGRRRRPGCCCEVQARRARPIRGEVSQARQGQVRQPALAWSGPGHGPGLCPGPCPASTQAQGPLFGPWPFMWGFHWPIIYMVLTMFPCGVAAK